MADSRNYLWVRLLMKRFAFYEFFCGGGMARIGLGSSWECIFANDIDYKKTKYYSENFRCTDELITGDIKNISSCQLPGTAKLAWASFPCQDLSLAGAGAGLNGERSGVFWPFWNLIIELKKESRNPPIIVLENVVGLLTSHNGDDFYNLIVTIVNSGYYVGAVTIDGAYFVPQSRPRLFIVCAASNLSLPKNIISEAPDTIWHPKSLRSAVEKLPIEYKNKWLWWNMPLPNKKILELSDIIENDPEKVSWHSISETSKIISMMSAAHLLKINEAKETGIDQVGTIYKRTRNGVQRAEVRFDGLSGCLRTPIGGSSRQIIIHVLHNNVRTRLITARETARLMGLPDTYILPDRYNDAYHLTGDGVIVPAVSWLEKNIIHELALQLTCS
jgi:DNA (cytosine-5)-methyltransferase 1